MRTLLIVDDQPSVVAALTFLFTSRDYAVISAANGADALALAETQAFDGALIDLHMPGMDGIAVCRALAARSRSLGLNTVLWVMTAAYTGEAARRAVEAGARTLLRKPFNCAELLQEIDTCLAPAAASIAPPPAPAAPVRPAAVARPVPLAGEAKVKVAVVKAVA